MQQVIYIDLRFMQDPAYRVRGIGQHVAGLLRERRHSPLRDWKAIGLVDPDQPPLPPDCRSYVDEISASANPCCTAGKAIFIDGTPMTHDPRFGLRFQSHTEFIRAAVLHDFIPLDWPGYLPTVASRIQYLAKLSRLRGFNVFLPVSNYTGWRASQVLGIPSESLAVTGAAVRAELYEIRKRLSPAQVSESRQTPYFLIVIAEDPRKNPEVAIRAVRHLNLLYGTNIPLKVAGHRYEFQKRHLLSLAGHEEGRGFLEFHPNIPDEQLVSLYAGARATIVPSHLEGFSLPVVEAAVCGCPVIASTCAAHLELITQTEALFPSHDAGALAEKLELLLTKPSQRSELQAAQSHLAEKFHESLVGERFWQALAERFGGQQTYSIPLRNRKPKIAFLTPWPPDQSGVARFTAATIQANQNLFTSDVYTDAPRPLEVEDGFRDAGRISLAPLVRGQYDAVVSVLGNSHFHIPTFELFERYGGPCILHDARLIQIYIHRLGESRFLQLVSRLLGRPVDMVEVNGWLNDPDPETVLLEPVVRRAKPLIVHTKVQQARIKAMYNMQSEVITSCPTVFFAKDELAPGNKELIRSKYGISSNSFLISSFGIIGPEKGYEECVLATKLLRTWNIPAELQFVGDGKLYKSHIEGLAATYDIGAFVHVQSGFAADNYYRDFLIASDVAVQLRTYAFGQFSAALADCVSAGLPSVATSDLAASCDAPSYVRMIPDRFSPLQVAERLAEIWEDRLTPNDVLGERLSYLKTHNYTAYGERFVEVLGLV